MSQSDSPDLRSVLVLAEPLFGPGSVSWHGMAFAGGAVINDVIGSTRTVVLEECLSALDEAGIEVETGPPSPLPAVAVRPNGAWGDQNR